MHHLSLALKGILNWYLVFWKLEELLQFFFVFFCFFFSSYWALLSWAEQKGSVKVSSYPASDSKGNLSLVHCWEGEVKMCLHIASCPQVGKFRCANSVLLSVIISQDTWVALQGGNLSFLLSYCQINLPWILLQWYSKVQDALLYNLVKCFISNSFGICCYLWTSVIKTKFSIPQCC